MIRDVTPRRLAPFRVAPVSSAPIPLPIPNLRHVLAMLVDVMLVLDEFVLELLLQVRASRAQLRQPIDHVHHQVEPVEVILHPHIKGRGDRAFFLIAADVQVAIGSPVGQPVDQPRIAMKAKDDVLVLREQRVVILFVQSVRVLRSWTAVSSDPPR